MSTNKFIHNFCAKSKTVIGSRCVAKVLYNCLKLQEFSNKSCEQIELSKKISQPKPPPPPSFLLCVFLKVAVTVSPKIFQRLVCHKYVKNVAGLEGVNFCF